MGEPTNTILSTCECQALLGATLDRDQMVLGGWADRGGRMSAPAQRLSAAANRFEVAWNCPFCGRNTLRSFHEAALRALPPLG